jgi:hypothetical protein
MSKPDIVERLRNWRTVHLTQLRYLLESAADEIERLRQVSSQKNLTDEERDVLREVCLVYADEDDVECNEISFVIDRIMDRLGAANSTPIHRTGCGESRAGSDGETAGEEAAKCTVKSAKLPERDRLTDAERKALTEASEFYTATRTGLALSGLLARLSPPAT